jgi:site-specific DNA recombinase
LFARCYLRVSTEDQAREGYSLAAQRDRLNAFAASQDWKVATWYVDEGISAKDMNRPALKQLLADARKGEVVLVYKLDRLTRNVADLDYLLRKWEGDGILFRSATEDFNTTTAAGRLFIRLVADLAQWERENLGERVRMGMMKRAQEGEWNGGPPPFGYDLVQTGDHNGDHPKRKLVPNEHSPVVRELYDRYISGQGVRTLTLWLNREKGVKSRRGGAFRDCTVSAILKNPIYAGLVAWDWGTKAGPRNEKAIVVEGQHEPIVSREVWEQAQAIRSNRRSLPPRHATGVNILTGVGRCGVCRGSLVVNHDGRRGGYRAYRCANYANAGTCTVSSLSAAQVEASFMEAVCEFAAELAEPDQLQAYLDAHLAEQHRDLVQHSPADTRRQLAQVRQAIAVWDAALERAQIGFDVWHEKTAAHYVRLKDLEAQLFSAEESSRAGAALHTLISDLQDFRPIWEAATPEERKTLAISFFQEVRVFPDKRVELIPRLAQSQGL